MTSLFTLTLAAPITLTFAPPRTPGDKFQRPPLTLTQLPVAVRDDGSTVTAEFVALPIPRLVLWSAASLPPYASNPPGTGPGETWTNATVQARVAEWLGTTQAMQTSAIRSLFPAQIIV